VHATKTGQLFRRGYPIEFATGAIATCKTNPMPTLIVAPALSCIQWFKQFKDHAPELSVIILYCTPQVRDEEKILNTDIIVINSSSTLLESVLQRVKRVVVDESHDMHKIKGTVGKFVHNLNKYPNVEITWFVSGT
jgi:hypothetical protein